jgi:hypothetical protein
MKVLLLLALVCQSATLQVKHVPLGEWGVISNRIVHRLRASSTPVRERSFCFPAIYSTIHDTSTDHHNDNNIRWNQIFNVLTGAISGILYRSPALTLAIDSSEVEISELPNPIVPVLVGLGLVVGVGVLTSSLGDVMTEEASLGLQSGARAKKEIERSRSSYFKK